MLYGTMVRTSGFKSTLRASASLDSFALGQRAFRLEKLGTDEFDVAKYEREKLAEHQRTDAHGGMNRHQRRAANDTGLA
jgi:hypothetical protein